MDVFKPGKGRPHPRSKQDKIKHGGKKSVRDEAPVDDTLLPSRIEVKHTGKINTIVPGHVWRQGHFKWNPITFATESEQLNSKFVEPATQDRSLIAFLKDPKTPMIYGVGGNPDDSKAKYFAAYLVSLHLKVLGQDANVVWAPMYGGFDNPYLDDNKAPPTMLVLTGLTTNSTTTKLEKARDIVEKFSDVPRIVVVAGIDPLSFLATRLYVPVNGLAYFSEALVKQRIEVI